MAVSSAARLIESAGLQAHGPVAWGAPVACAEPGVYVIELPEPLARVPIEDALLEAWIARVPSIRVDGAPATVASLRRRLEDWWVRDEAVVYIGRTSATVASRMDDFYRTPLGDPRPHAGGHWLKAIANLASLKVWWAASDDDVGAEAALLAAFAARRGAGEPRLPFANREDAAKVRKPHGITGSTLPRRPRALNARRAATRSIGQDMASLAAINDAIQRLACASPDRRVTAVEAARELERLGLLADSASRRGLPLRRLLRDGRIAHAYQVGGRWWFIDCGVSSPL